MFKSFQHVNQLQIYRKKMELRSVLFYSERTEWSALGSRCLHRKTHYKNIRIFTDILRLVFHILT